MGLLAPPALSLQGSNRHIPKLPRRRRQRKNPRRRRHNSHSRRSPMPNYAAIAAVKAKTGLPVAWGSLVVYKEVFRGVVIDGRDGEWLHAMFLDDPHQTPRWVRARDPDLLCFEEKPPTKLREWLVRPADVTTWDDADKIMVITAHDDQAAKYRGWKILQEAGKAVRADLYNMCAKPRYPKIGEGFRKIQELRRLGLMKCGGAPPKKIRLKKPMRLQFLDKEGKPRDV